SGEASTFGSSSFGGTGSSDFGVISSAVSTTGPSGMSGVLVAADTGMGARSIMTKPSGSSGGTSSLMLMIAKPTAKKCPSTIAAAAPIHLGWYAEAGST